MRQCQALWTEHCPQPQLHARSFSGEDALSSIKVSADHIGFESGRYFKRIGDTDRMMPFSWCAAPDQLPESILTRISAGAGADKGNDYARRIGLDVLPWRKGNRKITDIPYGVDKNGNVLRLDFENSNFATFYQLALPLGKVHFAPYHHNGHFTRLSPRNDIEMWLIDFKMTEFSRYIKHTPPHVRYILLDESPELVYDLLDRLNEILTKRQNIFKGQLAEARRSAGGKVYARFICDHRRVFGDVSRLWRIRRSTARKITGLSSRCCLRKAALGMHFIFSSQGFTSGTRGLNDFSKKQIQQRIAMKTEYYEIKETLDLNSPSDADRF